MVKNKLTIHGVTAADFTIVKDPTGYYVMNNAVIIFGKTYKIGYKKLCTFKETIRFNYKQGEFLDLLKIRCCLVDRNYRKFYFFVNSNYIKGES